MRNPIDCRLVWIGAAAALALAACNGAGMSGAGAGLPATSAQAPVALGISRLNLGPITTYPGAVNGEPNLFHPPTGDTPRGGHGQRVDGIGCYTTMVDDKYHIHVFVGFIYNQAEVAIPTTIGMEDPGAPKDGFTNHAKCFYRIHTHDSSGIVHLEFNKSLPPSAAVVRLKQVMDVWGVRYNSEHFGPFKGPVHIFYGKEQTLGQLTIDSYKPFYDSFDKLELHSHEVVWIEIGDPYYKASELPSVTFYTEY
ncbi:MAG: hypothetical protein WA814_09530 [Candidatus Baltobacteraceae bacterium]